MHKTDKKNVVGWLLAAVLTTLPSVASAQAFNDVLIQAPQLAAPERGSITGSLAGFSLSSDQLARGSYSLPSPIAFPDERGGPLVALAPSYSPEGGISEWGLGWRLELSVTRSPQIGEPRAGVNEFVGPWGRLESASDGFFYPQALASRVRFELTASDRWIAIDSEGTQYEFDHRVAGRDGIHSWLLTRAVTLAGDETVLTYELNSSGRPFVRAVVYGGRGDTDAYRATFVYESLPDAFVGYRSGIARALDRRIQRVDIDVNTTAGYRRRWTYGLTYSSSPLSPSFYLTGVRRTFASGDIEPATTFAYDDGATTLAAAGFEHVAALDDYIRQAGTGGVQPDEVSQLDVDRDGLLDLEHAYANATIRQRQDGWTIEATPTSPNSHPRCRRSPSSANAPRHLASMTESDDEARVVVTDRHNNGESSIFVCDRPGTLLSQVRLAGDWQLSATVRLADLNRDQRPDIVRHRSGSVAVLENRSDEHGYQFAPGPTQALVPEFSPTASWIQDINGDGVADLVSRRSGGLIVWFGRGQLEFETVGAEFSFVDEDGDEITVTSSGLWFTDANKDGLMDVLATFSSDVRLFTNRGDHFAQRAVPGLAEHDFVFHSPAFGDFAANGNAQVLYTQYDRDRSVNEAHALSFNTASTGLLVASDDGKGNRVSFGYARAVPESELGHRASLLATVTVESAGLDAVTVGYDYAHSYMHTLAKTLIGFGEVRRSSPFVAEESTYLADDAVPPTLTTRVTSDERTPGLRRIDSTLFEVFRFHEILGLRPVQLVGEWSGGGQSVLETTEIGYASELCATRHETTNRLGTLVRESTLAAPADLIDGLHCLTATESVSGSHFDSSLDFSESIAIARRRDGQIERVTRHGARGPQILQETSYDDLDRVVAISVPGRGQTAISYDPQIGLPQAITDPSGVVTRVWAREPLTAAIQTLQTDRGPAGVFDQHFRHDGFERLASAWDDVHGGSESDPLVRTEYRFADAAHPGSVTIESQLSRSPTVRQTAVELFFGDGAAFASYARTPQGWAATQMETIDPNQMTSTGRKAPPLASSGDPRTLDFATLTAGATAVSSSVRSGFGHVAEATTVVQSGVVRQLSTTMAIEEGALVSRVRENDERATAHATTIGVVGLWSIDAAGNRTNFTSDALGRLRRVTLADGSTMQRHDYDDYGRTVHIERTGAGTIDHEYDLVTGLLAQTRYGEPAGDVRIVEFDYDAIGRITARRDILAASGELELYTFDYDGGPDSVPGQLGRLSQVSGPEFVRDQRFNRDGTVAETSISVGGWRIIRWSHDYYADGTPKESLRTVIDASTDDVLESVTTTNVLDSLGRPKEFLVGDTRAFDMIHDSRNRLLFARFLSGTTRYSFDDITEAAVGYTRTGRHGTSATWTFNDRGLISREVTSAGSTRWDRSFAYDSRGFLTAATSANAADESYAYDANGLISAITDMRGARAIERSEGSIAVGGSDYVLDGLGRVVEKDGTSFVYGPSGQVSEAHLADGKTISYAYDERGNRISKRRDGVIESIIIEDGYLDASGFLEPVHIDGRLVGIVRGGSFELVQADSRGSLLTDADGTPNELSAYGSRDGRPELAAALDYVEKGYDADIGIVRMGVRDYDPHIGQFLTPDPLFLGSIDKCAESPLNCNLYGYAANNPLSHVDPSGLEPEQRYPAPVPFTPPPRERRPIARASDLLGVIAERLDSFLNSYDYVKPHDIGSVAEFRAPEAMKVLQERPNDIFPFQVLDTSGNPAGIAEGVTLKLNHVRWPGDTSYVMVERVSETSFQFNTSVDHFDGPGAIIRFTTFEQDGRVILRKEAWAPGAGPINSLVAPIGAKHFVWKLQADNLREALIGPSPTPCVSTKC